MAHRLIYHFSAILLILALAFLLYVASITIILLPAILFSIAFSLGQILEGYGTSISLLPRLTQYSKKISPQQHLFFATLSIITFIISSLITMLFGYYYALMVLWYVGERHPEFFRAVSIISLLAGAIFALILNWFMLKKFTNSQQKRKTG